MEQAQEPQNNAKQEMERIQARIERQFGKVRKPWSLRKKLAVWGTAVAIAIGAPAAYYFISSKIEADKANERVPGIIRLAPGLPSQEAFEAAKLANEYGIKDSTLAAIKFALDTSGVGEKFGFTVADIVRIAVKNKNDVLSFIYAPDGSIANPFREDGTDAQKKQAAALNLAGSLPPKAKADLLNVPYVEPPKPLPDTAKASPEKKKGKKGAPAKAPKHSLNDGGAFEKRFLAGARPNCCNLPYKPPVLQQNIRQVARRI